MMGRVDKTEKRWASMLLAAAMLLTLVVTAPLPAEAAPSRDGFEYCLLDKANAARASAGLPGLTMAWDLIPEVREWSRAMRYDEFEHMPLQRRRNILPNGVTRWAENIARHGQSDLPDCAPIHRLWMESPGHRSAILQPEFRFVAIGTYVDSSGWWATQLFFDATGYNPGCNGRFCDDDGSVFEADIERIADAGTTEGCNPPVNNLFCPHHRVTRGAMAAFLARALDLPHGSTVDFSDDDRSVFENDIERIAGAGITAGCNPPTNTRFCPDDYVTRGQMAAFLARALGLSSTGTAEFADDDDSVFERSIEMIAAAGITAGCNPPSNTRFCPDEYVTRGQMAAFLSRAFDVGS